ncbi:oxygen-independent coproporphyrinogen III oxidase [Methylobrevis albus]|uniref:Coproporphyrinogen-III oxidase n=1 Tax=Methylobrevis albus TaxID=2793297 RepID=A0A931I3G8_9HYPH|nr:oxygen-independent coproporphyrinogen III oxidase [Methylobrevis albus]MBH0238769.1 oxygen-independent coproporphyrinogen III oxidase [Methylobrevis albus]
MTVRPAIALDQRLPRYTSYPTAPHFSAAVDGAVQRERLAALPDGTAVSLYLHVPFCAALCTYCGCQTSVVNSYRPIAGYVDALIEEITLVAAIIGRRLPVRHLHFGGGTPDLLSDADLDRLFKALGAAFDLSHAAETAIEIDPRTLRSGLAAHLARLGFTRASLGVQDFDPVVQAAIGRRQSFEVTATAAAELRAAGMRSVNLDLVYGLPHQTAASIAETVRLALQLDPDRVALFGYAHVPWMRRHQQLIPEAALPGPAERLEQAAVAGRMLEAAGLVAIGIDHFAKPGDDLARALQGGRLHRNFQGYTTDDAPALIGFGASSVSRTPGGYAQNEPATPAYLAAIAAGRLPVVRGIAFSPDDRLRAAAIEAVMCDLAVDLSAIAARFGRETSVFAAEIDALHDLAATGLVAIDGQKVTVPPEHRPLVRHVAAVFDSYLDRGVEKRHALAV